MADMNDIMRLHLWRKIELYSIFLYTIFDLKKIKFCSLNFAYGLDYV